MTPCGNEERMTFLDQNIVEFSDELASKAAVPGGGGASALVGALGVALASMVGNLTVGKKKYADVEEQVLEAMAEAQALREELLALIDADAAAFEPLSRAYSIPRDDPSRPEVMEAALRVACEPPLGIMRAAAKAIDLHARMAQMGSALAISDVGVGVACCKAALQGASLNVFINAASMADRAYADDIEAEADALLETYCARADEVYASVVSKVRG